MATPSKRPFVRGFAADAPTERALRAGLAGRDVQIQRGRLPAALRTLAAEPSSSLVFVDLDGVSEPEAAARQLTGICAFETAVVAIGSTDTAQYGRALLQHGISDYLVKPVTSAAIREAASTLTDGVSEHLYAGKVVAFAGSAGSGRSTLVAALARGIAEDGRTATVVDLDPVGGRLPALLDTEPRDGLASLLAASGADTGDDPEPHVDPRRIDEVATPAAEGISLLAYVPDGSLPARPAAPVLSALFRQLANRTHVVLATGFADPATQIDMLRQADDRMLLYEPSLASIGAAVRLTAQVGGEYPVTLVQCSTRMRRYPLSPAHVRYALADRRPDVEVPFEPALHATATGKPPGRPGKAWRKALRQAMELIGKD